MPNFVWKVKIFVFIQPKSKGQSRNSENVCCLVYSTKNNHKPANSAVRWPRVNVEALERKTDEHPLNESDSADEPREGLHCFAVST